MHTDEREAEPFSELETFPQPETMAERMRDDERRASRFEWRDQ